MTKLRGTYHVADISRQKKEYFSWLYIRWCLMRREREKEKEKRMGARALPRLPNIDSGRLALVSREIYTTHI